MKHSAHPAHSAHRACSLVFSTILAGATMAVSGTALAQADYPSKPVTIIVPFEGKAIETDLRFFIQGMNLPASVTFLIEQKAGAAGSVGANFVARAKPDGYTLLTTNNSFTITAATFSELPYDVTRDFAPVSLLTQRAFLILTNAATPYKSLKDYLDYARAHPGEVNYSTSGVGSSDHLPGLMLHHMTNTKVTFVHYKSSSQRLLDLVADRVQAAAGTIPTTAGQVQAGKMRPLAVTTNRRVSIVPDLPSAAEIVPGFDFSNWIGMLAPAKTPPAIVNRLNQMWVGGMRAPASAKKLESDGTLMVGSTPEEFQKFIATDYARWKQLAKETGLELKPE